MTSPVSNFPHLPRTPCAHSGEKTQKCPVRCSELHSLSRPLPVLHASLWTLYQPCTHHVLTTHLSQVVIYLFHRYSLIFPARQGSFRVRALSCSSLIVPTTQCFEHSRQFNSTFVELSWFPINWLVLGVLGNLFSRRIPEKINWENKV